MQSNPTMRPGLLLSRRRFGLACAGACAGVLALPAIGRAGTPPHDRSFAIFRDGNEIGRHDVRFQPTVEGFDVTTEIEVTVKVAFITAFRFTQRAVDHWTDGRLVESRATTDDNGKTSATEIQARGAALSVEGGIDNRTMRVPLGTMTDIAFWNPDIVRQQELLDIQQASLTDVAPQARGVEVIEVAGMPVRAERFSISSRAGRNGDVWFDAAGNWVKGHLVTRGEGLDYRLIA